MGQTHTHTVLEEMQEVSVLETNPSMSENTRDAVVQLGAFVLFFKFARILVRRIDC